MANNKEVLEVIKHCCEECLYLPQNQSIEQAQLVGECLSSIEYGLDKLENIKSKTHLLYGQREAIAKEYIDWCEKNKAVLTDPTNMVTWFLTVKLKEWLENDK